MFHTRLMITVALAALLAGHVAADVGQVENRKLTIPRIAAPRIDGDVTDLAWTEAVLKGGRIVCESSTPGSHLTKFPRVACVAYDNEAIYISVVDFSPDPSQLKDGGASPWNGDDIELFFQHDRTNEENVIQVAVSPSGHVAVNNIDKVDRKSDGVKVATTREGIRWITEIAVPFKFLQVDPPKTGDVWGFNLAGKQTATVGWICWNTTYGGFYNFKRFGVLTFGE